jgi:hypothetical protein
MESGFYEMRTKKDTDGTYINNHADSGQRSSQVLSMRGSYSHRYAPRIQAAIECSN